MFKKNIGVEGTEKEELKIYMLLEGYLSRKYKKQKITDVVKNNATIKEFLKQFFTIAELTFSRRIKAGANSGLKQ